MLENDPRRGGFPKRGKEERSTYYSSPPSPSLSFFCYDYSFLPFLLPLSPIQFLDFFLG